MATVDYQAMALEAVKPFVTERMNLDYIAKEWAAWLERNGVEVQEHANEIVAAMIRGRIERMSAIW